MGFHKFTCVSQFSYDLTNMKCLKASQLSLLPGLLLGRALAPGSRAAPPARGVTLALRISSIQQPGGGENSGTGTISALGRKSTAAAASRVRDSESVRMEEPLQ